MDTEYFNHPRRFPKNVDGPFYTTGHQCPSDGPSGEPLAWLADCLQCEAPEAEAPALLAELGDDNLDTYFVAQPNTEAEVAAACMAARVCCTFAIRYGGRDRSIIAELDNDPSVCDYIDINGELQLVVDDVGDLLPFAQKIAREKCSPAGSDGRQRGQRRWQFWR